MPNNKDYLPKLLEYIDLTNKIPRDFGFPVYSFMYELTIKRVGKTVDDGCSFQELIETYQDFLKSFPSDLYNYVFNADETDDAERYKEIIRKVELLSSLNHGLRTLAFAITEEMLLGEPIDETIKGIEEFMPQYSAILTASIEVNKDGHIELKTTEFFDFITKHKIEARRIRSCVICGNTFWAKRIENLACSRKCGNAWRQKVWQFQNKDTYNEKRRSNYAYKKAIKKTKGEKN